MKAGQVLHRNIWPVKTRYVTALAWAALLPACVGGDDTYDRAATESCLRGKGYSPKPAYPNELLFGAGREGGITIDSGDTNVLIAFDEDAGAANDRAAELKRFVMGFGPRQTAELVETSKNVVYWPGNVEYWVRAERPDKAFDDISDCLTE
jgi:hypothetical protein